MKSVPKIIVCALLFGALSGCQKNVDPAQNEDTAASTKEKPLTVEDMIAEASAKNGRATAETLINKVSNRTINKNAWMDVMVMGNSSFDRSATYLARLYVYTSGAQVDLYASDFVGGGWRVLTQNTSNQFPQKEITFLLRADAPQTYIKVFGRTGNNVRFDLALYKISAPAVEKINWSASNSNQTNLPYGSIYGYIGTTAVYSNGPKYTSSSRNSVNGYDTGLAYQCVELVRRFYYQYYGKQMGAGYNAKDFFANAYRWGMTAYANGGGMAPKPGDILCFNGNAGGGAGHVAPIVEVGADYVIIVQQNVYGDTHVGKKYSRTGNTINVANLQGWIR
ncbi:CHAP domain-containing protein [Runella slithyformis]|nr:CHAP domain-containing protein [Runella slithyformis]